MHVARTLGLVMVLLLAAAGAAASGSSGSGSSATATAAQGKSAAPLCTRFVIKERVPRSFAFAIPKNAGAQSFTLDATVESQKGTIACTRGSGDRADCRVSKNPQDPVVVTLDLASTDPDNMGQIVAGFTAGDFSIGKGGWTLKCSAAPTKSSAPPKPKKAD